jgi:MFS family permease
MLTIVLIVITYNLTHSNFAVSILIMTFLIPQVLFSFLGGIIADAKNKRKILIFGNISRAIVLVLFFFVKDTLVFIYAFQLAIAFVTQFYIPAEAPIIPHLVKRDQLLSANAIFGVCLFGSILIGYVAAGPAMRIFPGGGIFLFIAALFAAAYVCVQLMPDVAPSVRKLRTEKTMVANMFHLYRLVGKEFRDVIRILRSKNNVTSSLLFLALSQIIILVLATLIPDYAQKTLRISAEDISLVIFAPAALGTLLSALVIGSKFAHANKEKVISFGIFLSSIILFLFGVIDQQKYFNLVYLSLGITFLAGVANSCIFVPAQTIVQTNISHKSLSKVYGLLFVVVGIFAFVPIILAGVFADVLGVRSVLIGMGILLLLLGLAKVFLFKKKESLLSKLS